MRKGKNKDTDSGSKPVGLTSTPFDPLFRVLFTNRKRAGDIMSEHLPEAIAKRLVGDPQLIDGSFVDEALRGSHADRLFEVRLTGDKQLLVYVLLEHKSTPDSKTPFQIARYMLNIWERYANNHPDRKNRLPAILPLVFYHGQPRWNVPLSVFDMIADDADLRPYTRSLAYMLRDLGAMSPEQMSSMPDIRAVFQALNIHPQNGIEFERLINLLARLGDETDLEIAVLHYMVRVKSITHDTLRSALQQAKPERWENLMGTIAETWIEQGKAVGITEGKAVGITEGKAIGITEGKAEAFLRLAQLKFGEVPPPHIDAVRYASATQLDHWLEALITAKTLENIFKPS